MGLGKTVEVLACVLNNPPVPFPPRPLSTFQAQPATPAIKQHTAQSAIPLEESVCLCGMEYNDTSALAWIQCYGCHAWLHSVCAGKGDLAQQIRCSGECLSQYCPTIHVKGGKKRGGHYHVAQQMYCEAHRGREDLHCVDPSNMWSHVDDQQRGDANTVDDDADGDGRIVPFCCLFCSKSYRTGLVRSPTTLIVCPALILPQWKSELERHTTAGSLRVTVRGSRGKLAPILYLTSQTRVAIYRSTMGYRHGSCAQRLQRRSVLNSRLSWPRPRTLHGTWTPRIWRPLTW